MNAKARRKTQKSAFYGAPTKDADHRRRNGEGHPAVCLPKGIGSCRRLPRFRAYGKCLSLSYVYIISPALPRVRRGHLAVCPPKGVGSCRKLPRFRAYGKRRYRLISPSRPKRKGRALPRVRAYGKLRRVSFDPVESARSRACGEGHLAVCPPKGVGSCRKLPRLRAYGKLRRVSFDPVESARSRAYGEGILRRACQRALALVADSRAPARTGSCEGYRLTRLNPHVPARMGSRHFAGLFAQPAGLNPHGPARMGKGALRHRRRRRCSAQRASRSSSTARQ